MLKRLLKKANNTSFADQAIQVRGNVHTQVKTFCAFMDEILLPNEQTMNILLDYLNKQVFCLAEVDLVWLWVGTVHLLIILPLSLICFWSSWPSNETIKRP